MAAGECIFFYLKRLTEVNISVLNSVKKKIFGRLDSLVIFIPGFWLSVILFCFIIWEERGEFCGISNPESAPHADHPDTLQEGLVFRNSSSVISHLGMERSPFTCVMCTIFSSTM